MMTETLMTVNEVAEYLQVSSRWVYTAARSKSLPGYQVPGGLWRFKRAEVESWLQEQA